MTSEASQVRVAGATPESESYVRTDERTEISIADVNLPTAVDAHRGYQDSAVEEVDWQPGDPLYADPRITHQRYLYNFRDDLAQAGPAEEGNFAMSPDAARWPTPGGNRALAPGDELGAFIRDYHEWRAANPDPTPAPKAKPLLERVVLGLLDTIGVHL